MSSTAGAQSWRLDAALFAVSAAVLTLEVLQTKIFAFCLDSLTIYFAVGICMLGLGASATALALAGEPPPEMVRRLGAAAAATGAVGVVAAHAIFARVPIDYASSRGALLLSLSALTAPYFCWGLVIALVLVARARAIARTYSVNLVGSGLGCLIVFPLLDGLGAERMLPLIAGLGLSAAFLLAPPRRPAYWLGAALIAVALAAAEVTAPRLFPFRPDSTGQLAQVLKATAALRDKGTRATATPVLSRWDRTARVDVYQVEASAPELRSRVGQPLDVFFFVQDASAGSLLLGVGADVARAREFFDRTVYGAGYAVRAARDVLIIGLGGAPDIQSALYHGAQRIEGVDINGATIDIVRNEFRSFLGDPYHRPGVTIHQVDGRAFLRQTDAAYDLIQLSGADTKSVFASGALSLNENYLYTQEAMRDMLRRLRPEGVLAIIRFGNFDVHRLASIAVAALSELGAHDPEQHLMAIAQGPFFWRALLVKRTPFATAEVDRVHAWVQAGAQPPDIVIPTYDWIGAGLRHPMSILYSPLPRPVAATPYFAALSNGQLDAFVAASEFDLRPPRDDRPFFFLTVRPSDTWRWMPPMIRSVLRLAFWLAVVSAAITLVPLVVLRWRGLQASGAGRSLVYFSCLGAGFMLAEIGLIQRFVLLLGHQTYAVTVVLFGLLAGAGLGSLASGWLPLSSRRPVRLALLALILVIGGYAFGLSGVFEAAAPLSFALRLTIALLLLVVLGFLLGVPFPTALRALSATNSPLIAWGIGVNGFASVLAGTLAIPLAMVVGFRAVLVLGALAYGVAALSAPVGVRDAAVPGPG